MIKKFLKLDMTRHLATTT